MINNPKIGIINHNFANLHSVKKALDYLNCPNIIINKPNELSGEVDGIILPGVGAFDAAMNSLQISNFIDPIKDIVGLGVPILGVCLGMQLLFESSLEGSKLGLSIMKGKIKNLCKNKRDQENYCKNENFNPKESKCLEKY